MRRTANGHQPSLHALFPHEVEYAWARWYQGRTDGREVELKWPGFADARIEGRTVLVLDDMLDEGVTIKAVIEGLHQNATFLLGHDLVVDGGETSA